MIQALGCHVDVVELVALLLHPAHKGKGGEATCLACVQDKLVGQGCFTGFGKKVENS